MSRIGAFPPDSITSNLEDVLDTWLTWRTLKHDVVAEVVPRLDAQARQLLGSSPEAARGASLSLLRAPHPD